jgi:hypothetical protein
MRIALRWAVGCAAIAGGLTPRPACADKNAFFRALHEKPRAEFRDLVAAVHMLARDTHEEKPFEQLRAELVVDGLLPEDWTYAPGSPVTRGMAAYGVCAALAKVGEGEHGIGGGLTLRVFGNSQRYALRECLHLGIVMPGSQRQTLRGGELLGILARARSFRKTGRAETLQLAEGTFEEAAEPIQQDRMKRQEQGK